MALVVGILLLAGCTSKGATGEAYKKNVELGEKELKATSCDGDDICEAKNVEANVVKATNQVETKSIDAISGCFHPEGNGCGGTGVGGFLQTQVLKSGVVEATTVDADVVKATNLLNATYVYTTSLCVSGYPERDCNPMLQSGITAGTRVVAREFEGERLLLGGCIITVNETTSELEVDC